MPPAISPTPVDTRNFASSGFASGSARTGDRSLVPDNTGPFEFGGILEGFSSGGTIEGADPNARSAQDADHTSPVRDLEVGPPERDFAQNHPDEAQRLPEPEHRSLRSNADESGQFQISHGFVHVPLAHRVEASVDEQLESINRDQQSREVLSREAANGEQNGHERNAARDSGSANRETRSPHADRSAPPDIQPIVAEEGREIGASRSPTPVRAESGSPSAPQAAPSRELDSSRQEGRQESRQGLEQAQKRQEPTMLRPSLELLDRTTPRTLSTSENRVNHDHAPASNRENAPATHEVTHGRGSGQPPAQARAEQVDAAIRAEQATGQQGNHVNADQLRTNVAQSPAHASPEAAARVGPSPDGLSEVNLRTYATGAASAHSTEATRLEESSVTSRIVRGLTAMVNQRGGALTMRLEPPELGVLRVQMTLNRGVVSAQIFANSSQAHGLLENNLAMLRTALESHGLTVERLSVQLTGPANQSNASHQQQAQQQDAGRTAQQDAHADAGDGQSRGRRDPEPEFSHQAEESGAGHLDFSGFLRTEAASTGENTRR